MIKILKLVTGEEIVGEVETHLTDNKKLRIKKPCVLQVVPLRNNQEQLGMALLPYAPYAKDHEIIISMDCVVWEQEPMKELYNQYNSSFGNGLVVASNVKL